MKNDGILTISGVPNDPEKAKLISEKIARHQVTLHPEQEDDILNKIRMVIEGTYVDRHSKNYAAILEELGLEERAGYAAPIELASTTDSLEAVLSCMNKSEIALRAQGATYDHLHELIAAKLKILGILKALNNLT